MSTQAAAQRAPHLVWKDALGEQLGLHRRALPANLAGVVQFAARTTAGTDFFHLVIAGADTRLVDGMAPESDTWIDISPEPLAELLAGGTPEERPFRVVGDGALYERFYDALRQQETSNDWNRLGAAR